MKYLLTLCSCIFFAIFQSCDYPNEGIYYKEVKKPDPEHAFAIELNPNVESFVIARYTELRMNLNTFGLNIDLNYNNQGQMNNCILRIDNKTLNFNIYKNPQSNNSYQIYTYINPQEFTEGKHTLSLYVRTSSSGSGSLADKAGMEGYELNKSWEVQIMDLQLNGTDMMPIKNRKSEDGFLELYWEKPPIQEGLLGYRVRFYNYDSGNNHDIFISGENNTSFIDKEYTYSRRDYTIFAVVKGFNDDPNDYWSNNIKYRGQITINEPSPVVSVKDNYNDSITVSWTRGNYKTSYIISRGYETSGMVYSESDTFAVVKGPNGVFNDQSYQLYLVPFGQKEITNQYSSSNYVNFSRGKKMTESNTTINVVGYNKQNNVAIAVENYNTLSLYHLPEFTRQEGASWNTMNSSQAISTPVNSPYIALMNGTDITVLDSQLNEHQNIYIGTNNYYQSVRLLENNSLILIRFISENSKIMIDLSFYDINNGNLLKTMKTESSNNYPNELFDISSDGKYLALSEVSSNKTILYDISGTEFEQIHVENKGYNNVNFHPLYKNMLILNRYGYVEVYEIPSFKLIHSIKTSYYSNFRGIDPATGYVMIMNDNNNCVIIDPKTNKTIKNYTESFYIAKLYGNILFSIDGRMYDLNKEISK